MAKGGHLENKKKSRYPKKRLADFEILHDDTY